MAVWSDEMQAPARRLRLGGRLVFASGRECALDGNAVSALTIEEGAGGALEPGCVLSAVCTLDLANDGGCWEPGGELLGQNTLDAATLMPELGIETDGDTLWHPLGVFQVESALRTEGAGRVRLQARDSISFELAEVFRDGLSYPCTLQQIWEHAVGQTGYAWSGNIPNGGAVIDAAPDWKDASLRTVMGYAAAAAGSFVRVDRRGFLELRPVWNAAEEGRRIDGESYLKLESGSGGYGPVDALRLKCTNAEEEKVYMSDESALFAVSISENPLFQAEAPGVDSLARGTLNVLSGFRSEALNFDWRGDPALRIGDRVRLFDRAGEEHAGVLTRQTLRFSGGFSASCACDVPRDNNSGVRRAITPEGGLNSAALVGAVNGALLSVGSVTTNKLAAGSVSAEKLAAGAVDAGALAAVTAKITSLTAKDIETDRLAAALAAFTVLTAGTADFDRATVGHLVAGALNLEFGAAGQVFIRNLAVEYAQMVGAAIGNLCIKASDGNYYRIDVNMDGSVSAVRVTVSNDEIAAGQTNGGRVILETNIAAANLNTGKLLATYALINRIDAARMDVGELFAREAFISALTTSRIFGGKTLQMIAGEADGAARVFRQSEFPDGQETVKPGDMLVNPYTGQQYQAAEAGEIGFALDEEGNLYYCYDGAGSLMMQGFELYADGFAVSVGGTVGRPYIWELVQDSQMVNTANDALAIANAAVSQADFMRVVRIDGDGLHVGDNLTECEVLLDSASVNVMVDGMRVSTFSDKFVRMDNMQIRKVRGGLAISVYAG